MSEISWMLPKILRMRRVFVERFPAGASIALVAIVFPALGENAGAPRRLFPGEGRGPVTGLLPSQEHMKWSATPGPPLQFVRPVRWSGPVPERTGKAPGRTKPCGGAVYLLDEADIILFSRM